MQKKAKCLLLFSGGLDSILAAKILMEQGIDVLGLTFKSCFFDEGQAKETAKRIGLKLKLIDFSEEHLKIVKNPKYGYGKNMNPCIDCHLLMLKKAKEIAKPRRTLRRNTCKEFRFVATGEVLGERPMSQNKNILKLLEKESGLEGYLFRPLSAKLLEPTIPEKRGLVDREKFFSISGRQRKKQFELAKKFKIKKYPTPSGGCCLTYREFSQRLKELLKKRPEANFNDIELLKYGRHFWKGDFLMVVGRNEKENKIIQKLKKEGGIVIEPKNFSGPSVLIRGKRKISKEIFEYAKELIKKYSKKIKDKKNYFKIS